MDHQELYWAGWGDPQHAVALDEAMLALLRDGLGVRAPTPPPDSIEQLRLAAPRLADASVAQLEEIVGAGNVHRDHESRARHALGRSTPDLLLIRGGLTVPAPDAVVLPADHDEVQALLTRCAEDRIAVVPYGGGTSVVGGLSADGSAFAGLIALDLRRLDQLRGVDELSRTATLGPGLRGPEAEALLAQRGYTIGHFPQSFEYATLGGFAAARSSGQASAGYGRFDELVQALKVATPAGTLTLGVAPRSAAGPDLRQLVLGSEGAFGVITELTVRVRPVPEVRVYDGWLVDGFVHGAQVLRALVQDGPAPTVLRLSDEAESAIGLARPDQIGSSAGNGCLAIVGYEGSRSDVEFRREACSRVLEAAGARPVADAGDAWEHGRYRGPYLRDALLDAGALVETLETATFWSGVAELYTSVGDALRTALTEQGTTPLILCHVSHVYPTGASLYFTVACAQLPDPVDQWRRAKHAASDRIAACSATISHHHGVGRDHRDWLAAEVGGLGIAVLAAVKRQLDPTGILNPGILIPG
jgi:alkyldihydroxyacetonephosphate synthase